jgi:AcrR family transcriptional regulator
MAASRLTRTEKQAATRRKLLDAAARVFVQRGFQGSSVETICLEAGFSRGAFYSNFDSKEQMFIELLQERVFEGYRILLSSIPPDLPPIERFRFGARKLQERYKDEREVWQFELWLECLAHAARHPEFRALASTFWSETRAMSAAAMEADEVPLPMDAKHVATAMIALDIGLAVQHLVDPDEVPLDLYPRLYELLFGPLFEG